MTETEGGMSQVYIKGENEPRNDLYCSIRPQTAFAPNEKHIIETIKVSKDYAARELDPVSPV